MFIDTNSIWLTGCHNLLTYKIMLPYESHLAAFMIENLLNCVSDIVERNSIYEMNMISINLIGKAVLKDPSDIKNSQERQDGG